MTKRTSHRDSNPRTVYYMGSLNIHIIAGGEEPPQLAIKTGRMDRADNHPIWSIIKDLTPSEYKRLNRLIAEAIVKFRKPGELHPWPIKRR